MESWLTQLTARRMTCGFLMNVRTSNALPDAFPAPYAPPPSIGSCTLPAYQTSYSRRLLIENSTRSRHNDDDGREDWERRRDSGTAPTTAHCGGRSVLLCSCSSSSRQQLVAVLYWLSCRMSVATCQRHRLLPTVLPFPLSLQLRSVSLNRMEWISMFVNQFLHIAGCKRLVPAC